MVLALVWTATKQATRHILHLPTCLITRSFAIQTRYNDDDDGSFRGRHRGNLEDMVDDEGGKQASLRPVSRIYGDDG
ncbi:unnamed protein product [Peronospora destructor]|uniref:Secreted protein n=1 Tax=Peronospora destructor TaxID=86335 RepID=A0AAV0V4P4_9STRA|nr:unnamed protein product [Peronospora destructor]